AGIGFCFAPRFHPALRFAAAVRRELGVPTTFNFLGPLANPAGVTRQAVGVADATMAERVVGALAQLGKEHVLVFYGHDGLDELRTTTTSTVYELREGEVVRSEVDPARLGLAPVDRAALLGGDAAANADAVHRVLGGGGGPLRDIVLLNAAAALMVADLAPDLESGLALRAGVIDDGRGAAALERFVAVSNGARVDEAS